MQESTGVFLVMLGQNIARIRQRKGLTQAQLADELEMDRSNLQRIESGRTNPTAMTLLRISKVLNVKPEELLIFRENGEKKH